MQKKRPKEFYDWKGLSRIARWVGTLSQSKVKPNFVDSVVIYLQHPFIPNKWLGSQPKVNKRFFTLEVPSSIHDKIKKVKCEVQYQ